MIPNGFACFNFKLDNDLRVFGFGEESGIISVLTAR